MSTRIHRCLAVDLGASSGRVLSAVYTGERLETSELHRFPNDPIEIDGHLCWNFPRLLAEVKHGLAKASKSGPPVDSIGVDTWGVDFGLIGDNGDLLAPPVHYRDERTRGIMDQLCARPGMRERIFAETGLQFMVFNTIYQLVALQRTHPEALARARHLLLMGDLFHYFLTGAVSAEFTNASTTQLLGARSREWSNDLIAELGLPRAIFPPIRQPGTVVGPLLPEVVSETGLDKAQLIAVATHDTGSAVAAVPAVGDEPFAYLSCGTWSLLGLEVKDPVLSPLAARYNITNEGGVFGTYRLLKNIMGLWLLQESRRQWEREGQSIDWPTLYRHGREAEPFRSLVDPDDPRFFEPGDLPARVRDFCRETNQPIPDTVGRIVRCLIESLCMKCRLVLGRLDELTGRTTRVVHMVGGGIRDSAYCQGVADACGVTVKAGPVEATAIGNIGMQLYGLGAVKSLDELRAVVARSEPITVYTPSEASADYEVAYGRFLGLLRG